MKQTGTEWAEVLVLRAWVEDIHAHGLRVRAMRVTGSTEPMTATTATVDGACAIVRGWLEDLLRAAGKPGPTAGPPAQ